MTAHHFASYVATAGKNSGDFGHSNLFFATKDEVKAYNAVCVEAGLFPADMLHVTGSDHAVNAKLDASSLAITLLPSADDSAKGEAEGEGDYVKSRAAE